MNSTKMWVERIPRNEAIEALETGRWFRGAQLVFEDTYGTVNDKNDLIAHRIKDFIDIYVL